MLPRNIANQGANPPSWWEELGHGAPTIAAFARLCADALQRFDDGDEALTARMTQRLSPEARVILVRCRARGTFEIRSNRDGFDSAERFLAVAIETEVDHWHVLLDKRSPEQTIRFLEGFRELCGCGLVMHHLQREFSLSAKGYDLAKLVTQETGAIDGLDAGVDPETMAELLEFGFDLEL